LYHDNHLYAVDWTSASLAKKEIALKMATRLLDERINWIGVKTTKAQSLRWGRMGVVDRDGYSVSSDVIPKDIMNATAEFARNLLSGDLTVDADGKGLNSMAVGSISLDFDKADTKDVLPSSVQEMLSGWGNIDARSEEFTTVKLARA